MKDIQDALATILLGETGGRDLAFLIRSLVRRGYSASDARTAVAIALDRGTVVVGRGMRLELAGP